MHRRIGCNERPKNIPRRTANTVRDHKMTATHSLTNNYGLMIIHLLFDSQFRCVFAEHCCRLHYIVQLLFFLFHAHDDMTTDERFGIEPRIYSDCNSQQNRCNPINEDYVNIVCEYRTGRMYEDTACIEWSNSRIEISWRLAHEETQEKEVEEKSGQWQQQKQQKREEMQSTHTRTTMEPYNNK